MSCARQESGAVELYFYGALPSGDRAPAEGISRSEFEGHLEACADCRQALDDLRVIRVALASQPDVATPPGGDWSGFMARLDTSIQRERSRPAKIERPSDLAPPAARWRSGLTPFAAAAAVLAMAALAAVLLLRDMGDPASTPRDGVPLGVTAAPGPAALVPAASPDPAFVSLSDQHFERSKLVVLGLATRRAGQPAGEAWEYERDLAATLLGDTRVYRQAAEARGMESLADVMRDLEFVLLQTSMSEEADEESLEQLQQLIRRQDLLTKMNAGYVGR